MRRPFTQHEYEDAFLKDKTVRAAALRQAEEVRRFEIELYWKRAAYFSTIIGVVFAGYGAVLGAAQPQRLLAFALGCVGLVLSFAWYLINRGSAAWQRNWETHVDLLEGDETGFLYKVVVSKSTYSWYELLDPLPVSPSRLTVAVSGFVTLVWLALVVYALPVEWSPPKLPDIERDLFIYAVLGVLTAVCVLLLMFATGTRVTDDRIRLEKRERRWL